MQRFSCLQRGRADLLRRSTAAIALALLWVPVTPLHADGGRHVAPPARYLDECASCHAPYPPYMLPTASWSAIMTSLDKHFGVNASVDTPANRELAAWLVANADQRTTARPADDRLTRSSTFLRKHREVRSDVWTRPSIKSPANCVACHQDAATGGYRERNTRVPAK